MDTREIEIDAPWGKIAAKLWGHEDSEPVLTIHGVQDNAGSFDGLIPLLPKFFFICIDLPGHGKSSHFPPHTPIHTSDYLMVYIIVMDYFKKDKYIIMGHSYGAQIGFLFSRMYPERVKKLIMLDTVHLFPVPDGYYTKFLIDRYSKHLDMETKLKTRSAPQYTYQEAFDKVMQNRPSPFTEVAAKALLKRVLVPASEGKYLLSTDQRLKQFINPLHNMKYVLESLTESPVLCPILLVFGSENKGQRQYLRPILRYLKKQKNVTVRYVKGHHDVHQTDPELVAPFVVEFLVLQKSKL